MFIVLVMAAMVLSGLLIVFALPDDGQLGAWFVFSTLAYLVSSDAANIRLVQVHAAKVLRDFERNDVPQGKCMLYRDV